MVKILVLFLFSFYFHSSEINSSENLPIKIRVLKSNTEWSKILAPEVYKVARLKGTEMAFSGKYNYLYSNGIYECIACKNILFDSKTKFDSGTGWPSFYGVANDTSLYIVKDFGWGTSQNELLCMKCDAHLGHVFNDGPKPTGLRYCINSVVLNFKKR